MENVNFSETKIARVIAEGPTTRGTAIGNII